MMRPLFAVALAGSFAGVLLSGCPKPPPPTPPAPDADAASESPSCATWCRRAAGLGCAAAQPTPAGASCFDVCQNTLDGPIAIDVACRTAAASCAAADQCENGNVVRPVATTLDQQGQYATCAGWCARAAAMKCPAAKPTPAGASCEAVCANAQTGPAPWNLRCKVAARTCALADACK